MAVEHRPRTSQRTIVQMVLVGLIASAIGIALGLAIDWFPVQGSKQAKKIDDLWDVLIVVAVPVFVLVTVTILFAVKEFRQKPGEELIDGPNIHGSTRLEIIWTAIPTLVIFLLVGYAATVLHDIEKAPADAASELKVDVYGEQFAWTFKYAGADGKPVNTTRLYLPKGRSVKFNVHSKDVIHDFWIPAMRMKIDAVPGITTHYRITPIREGTYPVVCAELCGLGHSVMRQTAYVKPAAEFDKWLADQSNPQQAAGGGSAAGGGAAGGGSQTAGADGAQLFADNGCGGCHTLAAANSTGTIGPDLDKVLVGMPAAHIKEDIVDPDAEITKGFSAGIMPKSFGQTLKPDEIDALVQYLISSTKK